MCDPSTGETERRPSRLYFNGSPPSGGGFHGEKSAFREKLREPASLRKVGPVGAVHRPYSPEFLEVLRLPRMPIPREDHRQPATSEQADRAVHPRDNCIALRHPERSAWTEVILDVDDEQRGPLPHGPDRPNVTVAKSLRPPG